MITRDDLRPGTTSLQSAELAGLGWPTRSEQDRAADTARACRALGIPDALPLPQVSPAMDEEAAVASLHAVQEYLRAVFGARAVQSRAGHLRPTSDRGVSSLRDAA